MNQKSPHFVTICLPTYNAGRTVKKTITSILNQTYQNLEIIIVDNASTDNTLEIVHENYDNRMRIFRNETNIGAENNWKSHDYLRESKGEYIAIFHADDIYCSDIIENEVSYFQKYPDIGAVFTSAYFIDSDDIIFGKHKLPFRIKNDQILTINVLYH